MKTQKKNNKMIFPINQRERSAEMAIPLTSFLEGLQLFRVKMV